MEVAHSLPHGTTPTERKAAHTIVATLRWAVTMWAAILTVEEALSSRRMARHATVDVDDGADAGAGGDGGIGTGGGGGGGGCGGCGACGGCGGGDASGSSGGGGGGGSGSGSWTSWNSWRSPRGGRVASSSSSSSTRQSRAFVTDCDLARNVYGSGGRRTVLRGGVVAHLLVSLAVGLAITMPWAFACAMPMDPTCLTVFLPYGGTVEDWPSWRCPGGPRTGADDCIGWLGGRPLLHAREKRPHRLHFCTSDPTERPLVFKPKRGRPDSPPFAALDLAGTTAAAERR